MKLNKHSLLTLCILFCAIASVSGQKIERLYNLPSVDTTNNYTVGLKPAESSPTALILLMPGFGESPSDVLKETDFPMQAAQQGYVVAIPYISSNTTLMLSDVSQKQLTQLTKDLQQRYRLQKAKVAVGGFSMGGTSAVKFTEHSLSAPASDQTHIAALFAVDPLLNLERFERTLLKAVQRNTFPMPKRQLQMLQSMLQHEFGATPVQEPEMFYSISPYTYSEVKNTAIKSLHNIPVLFYSEPDIENQFYSNHRDLYELNAADCTAMITDLRSTGN